MSTIPMPPDSRRCTATNRAGSRCRSWTLVGEATCLAHSGRGTLVHTDPAAAARRRGEKNRQKREAAERAREIRSMGLRDQMRIRLEEKASLVVDTIEQLLHDPDPAVRLRALDHWQRRVYGEAVRPSVNANLSGSVDQGTVNDLRAALESLPPDARAELARRQLKLLPPAEEA